MSDTKHTSSDIESDLDGDRTDSPTTPDSTESSLQPKRQKPLQLQRLDRFYREINEGNLSPEMRAWWNNRY